MDRPASMNQLRRKSEGITKDVAYLKDKVAELSETVSVLDRVLAAVTEVVGRDSVAQAVATARRKELDAETAGNDKMLQDGLKNGYVVADEAVGDESLIVVSESAPDGSSVPRRFFAVPGLAQAMSPPAVADLLDGTKKVGHEFKTPRGTDAKILEIYHVDEEKFAAWQRQLQEERLRALQEQLRAEREKEQGQEQVQPAEAPAADEGKESSGS